MLTVSDFGLDGKVVLVTGASSGLGRQCAVDMAALGANVVLGARRGSILADAAAEIESAGGRAISVSLDVFGLIRRQFARPALTSAYLGETAPTEPTRRDDSCA